MLLPVILSGGAGSRLWPLSRELYPKQLLPLCGEQTMLQQTVARLDGLAGVAPPLVVCNEEHRFMVAEQLRALGSGWSGLILEPVGRNTAPAVAVAALQAMADGADPLLLVLPADHLVADAEAFRAVVARALPVAEAGYLVTFGIVPDAPETGYGYIRAGAALAETADSFAVAAFVEKPDRSTAETYLADGGYYWNSGMFLFRAGTYLAELERHDPDMLAACRRAWHRVSADLDFLRLDADAFGACRSDSIDYAVMEKTERAAVLPLDAGWSDVGSFTALWQTGEKDEAGNVTSGDVLALDAENNYLHAGSRLLAAVGVNELVVVETADAVLVAHRDQAQKVKQVVEALKARQRDETLLHRRVNRPWGAYEGIDRGERFQVKRITVNPGCKLSLQRHFHRAEHWVVVSGTALVTCGEKQITLSENQSTYIPLGEVHRLENPGKVPLEIIEIQSGSYLGEDDIERLEDQYGR